MIVRSLIVAGLFAALGAGVLLRPTDKAFKANENWLEKQYPTTVGAFRMVPDSSDPTALHSYRMDDEAYRTLKPYGIVARVLADGDRAYDVVQIAGDNPDSFHNPLGCFAAQGWHNDWDKEVTIETRSRGSVRARLAQATLNGSPSLALYTYEAPSGTLTDPFTLGRDLLVSSLKTGHVQAATFFRFISKTPNVTEADITEFARQYLDASPVRPIEHLRV